MKNNKKDYGTMLRKDSALILIVLIISIICEIWFEATSNYDYLILIILYLIPTFSNKDSKKKSLGIIMIIASLLIIIESIIGFSSLFNLVFVMLGILSIYHSACYLKNLN